MGQLERIPAPIPASPLSAARIMAGAANDRQRHDREAPADHEPKDVIELSEDAPPEPEKPEAPDTGDAEIEPGGLDLSA